MKKPSAKILLILLAINIVAYFIAINISTITNEKYEILPIVPQILGVTCSILILTLFIYLIVFLFRKIKSLVKKVLSINKNQVYKFFFPNNNPFLKEGDIDKFNAFIKRSYEGLLKHNLGKIDNGLKASSLNKKIKYTAAVLLLIAILPLPIAYFTFLRICVSIASIISILQYRKENNQNLVICFGIILILFNPIIPIYLYSKAAWFLPDLITAGIFAYYGYKDDDYN